MRSRQLHGNLSHSVKKTVFVMHALLGILCLEGFDAIVEFANVFQQCVIFFVFADGLGRGAEHDCFWRHVFGQARHGSNHDLIADLDVSTETDLAGERDIISDAGAA